MPDFRRFRRNLSGVTKVVTDSQVRGRVPAKPTTLSEVARMQAAAQAGVDAALAKINDSPHATILRVSITTEIVPRKQKRRKKR